MDPAYEKRLTSSPASVSVSCIYPAVSPVYSVEFSTFAQCLAYKEWIKSVEFTK